MSAEAVIKQIENLTPEEMRKVQAFILEHSEVPAISPLFHASQTFIQTP
jgi:hypothetical protein